MAGGAVRPGQRRKLEPDSDVVRWEKAKASVRAKVEYPFQSEADLRV